MAQLTYETGDATRPEGDGPRVIAHVCNDLGKWGKGFVMALSKRWSEPEERYRKWHQDGDGFELGEVQLVEVESELWVANVIGQRGVRHRDGEPPIRYEAIRAGLQKVAAFAREHDASVHLPRIGAGLAGGDWSTIEGIVCEALVDDGVAVTVYDLP